MILFRSHTEFYLRQTLLPDVVLGCQTRCPIRRSHVSCCCCVIYILVGSKRSWRRRPCVAVWFIGDAPTICRDGHLSLNLRLEVPLSENGKGEECCLAQGSLERIYNNQNMAETPFNGSQSGGRAVMDARDDVFYLLCSFLLSPFLSMAIDHFFFCWGKKNRTMQHMPVKKD